jgi:alpha-1,6-mannosyltransferase
VLALHFAGGGHNDAWLIALVLAALALAATGRRRAAGVAWAAAALIKWVPLVLLPLRALEARARGRRVDHVGFAVTVAVVAAVASWQFGWHWLGAFGPLVQHANRGSKFAFPHRLESLGLPHPGGIVIFAVAFAAAYLWLAREAWRGRARLGLASGLLLVAAPWLVVWYVVWAVPLAAAEDDRGAQLLSLALCVYLLRQAIPL